MEASAAHLIENDPPRHADVAIVLAGEEYGTRILHTAELVKQGYAPFVLVSYQDRFGPPECQTSISYAIERGYPSSMFQPFENRADSTRSEAVALDGYMREHHLHSMLLVTSNYHTRRAAELLRKQDPALDVIASAAPDPYFTPDTWWKTRTGQKTFLLEWTKTVAAHLGI